MTSTTTVIRMDDDVPILSSARIPSGPTQLEVLRSHLWSSLLMIHWVQADKIYTGWLAKHGTSTYRAKLEQRIKEANGGTDVPSRFIQYLDGWGSISAIFLYELIQHLSQYVLYPDVETLVQAQKSYLQFAQDKFTRGWIRKEKERAEGKVPPRPTLAQNPSQGRLHILANARLQDMRFSSTKSTPSSAGVVSALFSSPPPVRTPRPSLSNPPPLASFPSTPQPLAPTLAPPPQPPLVSSLPRPAPPPQSSVSLGPPLPRHQPTRPPQPLVSPLPRSPPIPPPQPLVSLGPPPRPTLLTPPPFVSPPPSSLPTPPSQPIVSPPSRPLSTLSSQPHRSPPTPPPQQPFVQSRPLAPSPPPPLPTSPSQPIVSQPPQSQPTPPPQPFVSTRTTLSPLPPLQPFVPTRTTRSPLPPLQPFVSTRTIPSPLPPPQPFVSTQTALSPLPPLQPFFQPSSLAPPPRGIPPVKQESKTTRTIINLIDDDDEDVVSSSLAPTFVKQELKPTREVIKRESREKLYEIRNNRLVARIDIPTRFTDIIEFEGEIVSRATTSTDSVSIQPMDDTRSVDGSGTTAAKALVVTSQPNAHFYHREEDDTLWIQSTQPIRKGDAIRVLDARQRVA